MKICEVQRILGAADPYMMDSHGQGPGRNEKIQDVERPAAADMGGNSLLPYDIEFACVKVRGRTGSTGAQDPRVGDTWE